MQQFPREAIVNGRPGRAQAGVACVPDAQRRGRKRMFLLAPLRSHPVSRKVQLHMLVRAVQFRRGGMFLIPLLRRLRELSDPQHVADLPPSWRLLAELAELPPDRPPTEPQLLARTLLVAPAAPPARVLIRAGTAG